jgi:large repetitive protein
LQTGGGQQATPRTLMGPGTVRGAAPREQARPEVPAWGLVPAPAPVRLPRRGLRPGYSGLLAATAAAWMAAQAGMLAAQTPCPQDASYTASFSVSCSSLTCTFTNTSAPVPSGFVSLEWDFGDGNFMQGAPAAMSPFAYTYGGYSTFLVTMTLTAGDGQVAVATGNVTLNAPGQPLVPLAADDAFTTPENTALTIPIAELLANDQPGVTFYQITRCVLSPAGDSCVYLPPTNFVGVDSFPYSVRDALGNVGTANVVVTVTQPLVANPDYFSTFIGVPIQITSAQLLANDLPPNAVFIRAENPVNGSLSYLGQNAQGAAVYQFTPSLQAAGSGSFDYLISLDGNPPYAMGFAFITITDAPPVAAFTVQCTGMSCTVHSTSSDDTSIPKYVWDWGDGTVVTLTPPNQWFDQTHTYAQSGRYTITLTVTDTAGLSSSLALAVLANIAPVAANDSATTVRDIPVPIDVLANDSDADGDPLSIANVNLSAYPGASYAIVQLANGRWGLTVTPPNAFVGTMTFSYQACDQWGGCSAPATVTLTVTSAVVNALGDQFYCPQNGSLRIPVATLLANDYQVNRLPLSIVSYDTSILMGTLVCTSTACTYTPPINAAGFTLFRYTISDGHNQDTAPVRIYVGVADQAPTAKDIFLTTTWNSPVTFTINDLAFKAAVDNDGDTLTIGVPSQQTGYGTLTCSTPMYTCTYTPNTGYAGTDRFAYTASDMINPPVTAAINILMLPPPTPTFDAREDVIVTGVNQSAFFSSGLLSNDYVPSGGPETVTGLDTTGLIGTLSCSATGCTYYPPVSFQGTTRFKYTANDGHGATDTAIVKIKVGVTNNPPVAVPQTLSTPKNRALTFSVFQLMQNDYDPDNDPLTVSVYTVTAHLGTLTCSTPNYWCTYTPNADTTGADVITYALGDGTTTVTSTVTINITP